MVFVMLICYAIAFTLVARAQPPDYAVNWSLFWWLTLGSTVVTAVTLLVRRGDDFGLLESLDALLAFRPTPRTPRAYIAPQLVHESTDENGYPVEIYKSSHGKHVSMIYADTNYPGAVTRWVTRLPGRENARYGQPPNAQLYKVELRPYDLENL